MGCGEDWVVYFILFLFVFCPHPLFPLQFWNYRDIEAVLRYFINQKHLKDYRTGKAYISGHRSIIIIHNHM